MVEKLKWSHFQFFLLVWQTFLLVDVFIDVPNFGSVLKYEYKFAFSYHQKQKVQNWIFHSVAKSPKCLILIFMPKMMIIFGVKVKCKKCSLRSQWGKMRLFEWFWHTVTTLCYHGQAWTFWGQHSDFFCPRCASATQISASKVQILTGMKNKEERAE